MPYRQKHTFIFGSPQKGWTESFYIQDLTPTIQAGIAIANQVAVARQGLLGDGCFIKAIRVQEVEDAAGNKVKFKGNTVQTIQFPANAGQPAAQIDLSLMLDYLGQDNGRHRRGYLGGIWDSISTDGGKYTPPPGWVSNLATWQSKILEFGYGWVMRQPSVDFAITTFEVGADFQVTYTTAGTPFAAVGDAPFLINVHGLLAVGGMSVLNGNQMVTRVTDNSCRTVDRYAAGAYVGGGFINTYTYSFSEIAAIEPEKVVSRERGAPLLESVGRRPARRRT